MVVYEAVSIPKLYARKLVLALLVQPHSVLDGCFLGHRTHNLNTSDHTVPEKVAPHCIHRDLTHLHKDHKGANATSRL